MRNPDKDFIELECIAGGDEDTFTRVYNRYRNRVYGFAYRMLGVQSIAEEITQEAFLVLIRHPERYDPTRGSLLTFLCAVTRNFILSHFKHRGYSFEESYEELNFIPANNETEADPLSSLLEQELAEKISECMERLPGLQREAIVLREFQGLSYEEISIVTGVTVNVVKVRIHRARQILAVYLAPYMNSKGERYYEVRRS
jgi:RNA polymerase sigma-70 factor (ECF subfamily)